MSYDLVTLLAGLRAMARRAEERAEMVTLPPSKVNTLLDLVEPLVPDTRKLVSAHGQQFSVAAHIRLGVLTDLSFDNRTGAIHRLALANPHVTGGDLSAVLDAIEADAQEGTQQSS